MFKQSATLSYHLSVHSWERHVFRVRMTIPAHDSASLSLSLPAWIPGSYMIRDFARQIIRLEAAYEDGTAVLSEKTDKQTWKIFSDGQPLTVSYDVFAFDLSVRSAYINDEYAFCNGTSVFLGVTGAEDIPCNLSIEPPEDPSKHVHTSMPVQPRAEAGYQASNYDELIDHPIFIGRCSHISFTENNVTFTLLFSGDSRLALERIAEDLRPICQHHMTLFGDPQPVSQYLFMTLLSDSGFGGLEHRNSTALLFPRADLPMPGDTSDKSDSYINFLSLCSHELFHTWNVKRIKPDVMVTPDLSREVYTPQLWIYEGFTSFYDDLTLARSRVITPQKYLDILAQHLTRVMQNAGRHKQSAAQSSFDAWTRFYKQDANSPNHIVSYYTKGGIVALGLDLLLRHESANQYSLDDVMRVLWNEYGKEIVGTPDDVIETICQSEFGVNVNDYLKRVAYGVDDVPLANWLDQIGVSLHYRAKTALDDKGGLKPQATGHLHQLGAAIKNAEMGVTVLQVREGLAAERAGLQINDTILAMNGLIINDRQLQRMLDATDKKTVSLTVIRDGRVITLTLPVLAAQKDVCYFTIDNAQAFEAWLGITR